MKLIIDISEEKLNIIKNKMYCGIYDSDLYKAIANGTPLERIAELEKATNKTLLEMLADFASNDEYPPFRCDNCPLRLKDICKPFCKETDCYTLWLNYLTGKETHEET